ncbi:hypothetical protein CSUNSWCD_1203 [Campylobacter showae CSUNSWCD]|uniref:Lipoprotein n=2 Tax=Campylobacter showae TaxID=204 RepID=M5IR39_9BACT|nr:hypothetical protein CSUNSWCD_1203 [Campylobacter showae CSUNSWCD]EMG29819.1 hypothetical protein H740_09666 [Campylobacter showae CC57C]
MSNNSLSVFHKAILAFFLLIFIAGCGHKGDPFYEAPSEPSNSKTEKINKL